MRRSVVGILALGFLIGLVAWWLWPADAPGEGEVAAAAVTSANEGALPEARKQSSWNAPIQPRGERRLSGVVLRDGRPVAGAVVTGVAAHGEGVLSDLPCKCDNHCGQMLLACGCAEASGQLVELVGARTGEGAPLARTTSDEEGAFTLTGLEEGTVTLFADASDAVGWLANVNSDAQDVKVAVSEGRRIVGQVLSSDGSPARGALVTAILAAHSRFFDAVANEKGEFSLGPLPLGTYAVVAMQGGLLPDHQQVKEDNTEPLKLELSVPRSVSGVVLVNGEPVSGATVKLEGMHRKRTVTTDARGEFHVERLRPGQYELSAESTKGLGLASTVISKHEDRTGVTITLAGEPITGHVLTQSGAPVPAARVSLYVAKKWRSLEADEAGAFRFEGVTSEEHELFASKKGLLDVRGKARGGQSDVELRMSPSWVLSGRVLTSTGELVLKYEISATTTDAGEDDERDVTEKSADGGFSLDVEAREYTLRVEAPPLAPATLKVFAPASGLVLTMKPGAKIRGVVFDFDGNPAPKVRVDGSLGGKFTGFHDTRTDAAGRFELSGLEAGDWTVAARMREDSLTTWSATGHVSLSESGTAEVVLRPRDGAAFAGVVISANGEPLEGVRVMGWQAALDGGSEPTGMSNATTDAQGRFRLRSLRAGPVQLMALTKALVEALQQSNAPDEHVVVKLDEGGTISGRVVNSEGSPLTAFKVGRRAVDTADGRFSVPESLETKEVGFDAEGYAQLIKPVELKAGDNPLGDVVMQRGRAVTGVVRNVRTHLPIAGALVDIGLSQMDRAFLAEDLGAVKSDGQGRYRLPAVDSSSSHIYATADGYVFGSQPLSGNRADFELQPTSVLKPLDVTGGR